MLVGFGLSAARATAQTFSITYDTEFNFTPLEIARPDVDPPESINLTPLIDSLPPEFQALLPEDLPSELENPSILDSFGSGVSTESEPPFGLTNFTSDTFGLPITLESVPDPETGEPLPVSQLIVFRADPNDLNLDLPSPEFSDRYFGGETDRLLGLANDQAVLNILSPTEGTVEGGGLITVVSGEGEFEGASGEITFIQSDTFDPSDMSGSILGQATLEFSINTAQSVPEPSTNATLVGLGIIGAGVWLRRRTQQHL